MAAGLALSKVSGPWADGHQSLTSPARPHSARSQAQVPLAVQAGALPARSRLPDDCHLAAGSSEFSRAGQQLLKAAAQDNRRPAGGRRGRPTWRMEVADEDPLHNYRDSFGNDCAVERRARTELETSSAYQELVVKIKETRARKLDLVSEERFEDAAAVRDTLDLLEFKKRFMELSATPRVLYRVGDVVIHRRYGYRGVVYGHDPQCSAPKDWQDAMKIGLLPGGHDQPFYHVLVDMRDRPGGMSTYVAQENLVLQKCARPVLHPWLPKFFRGFQDGTYVPGSKLRQVYPNDW